MCIANGIITTVGQITELDDRVELTKYCMYIVYNLMREKIFQFNRLTFPMLCYLISAEKFSREVYSWVIEKI